MSNNPFLDPAEGKTNGAKPEAHINGNRAGVPDDIFVSLTLFDHMRHSVHGTQVMRANSPECLAKITCNEGVCASPNTHQFCAYQ